jgi:hypothetical protein
MTELNRLRTSRARKAAEWECLTCHSVGAVRWSEGGNLYRLKQDGTRGAKAGTTSVWAKWMTDRFGAQVVCNLCGAIFDTDQLSTSETVAQEDVRFMLQRAA